MRTELEGSPFAVKCFSFFVGYATVNPIIIIQGNCLGCLCIREHRSGAAYISVLINIYMCLSFNLLLF